jgi:transmembrane sensor
MSMERRVKHEEDVIAAERAADWLARLSTASTAEREEFVRWMKESPRNLREILFASSVDAALNFVDQPHRIDVAALIGQAGHVPAIGDVHAESQSKRSRRVRWPTRWRVAGGFAAGMLIVLGGGRYLGQFDSNRYQTSIGEHRSVELDEGSVISLNARSSIRVDFSPTSRDIYLEDGQALFNVARHAGRPFRVHVNGNIVEAIGTEFNIHRGATRTDVAVLEGRVRVLTEQDNAPALQERVLLGEGQALSIGRAGTISAPTAANFADVTAWRQRRLVFRGRPLGEIVEEFARYNRTPRIRVEGEALRQRRFDGVFDADDPETLVTYLATDRTIALDRRGDVLIIRAGPEPVPPTR